MENFVNKKFAMLHYKLIIITKEELLQRLHHNLSPFGQALQEK